MQVAGGPVWREREAKWPEQQICEQLAASRDLIEFEITPEELARIEFYLTQVRLEHH